jgi:hypothetical protein
MFTLIPTGLAGFSKPRTHKPVASTLSLPPRFTGKFAKESTQSQNMDQFVCSSPALREDTNTKTAALRPKTPRTSTITTASKQPTSQESSFEGLRALIEKPDHFMDSFRKAPDLKELKTKTDGSGNSLLHLTAASGKLKSVRFLIVEQGLSPTLLNEDGHNPAAKAALNGHRPVTIYLIDNYRDCQMQADHSGKVPFNHLREFQRRKKSGNSSIGTQTSSSSPAEKPARRRKSTATTTDPLLAKRLEQPAQKVTKNSLKAPRKSSAKSRQAAPLKEESQPSPKEVAAASPDFMLISYSPEHQPMGSPMEETEFSSWLLNEAPDSLFDAQMSTEPMSFTPIDMDDNPIPTRMTHFPTSQLGVSPFLTARGRTEDPLLYQTGSNSHNPDPFNGLAPELFIHPQPHSME